MYSVIKFQSPFERIKQYDNSPEINLNKAIITQAIIDATNTSSANDARKIEIEAKNWIFGDSARFREVCEIAQITPYFVRKIAIAAIKLQQNSVFEDEEILKSTKNDSKQLMAI